MQKEKIYLYLDDVRTPIDKIWYTVRNYEDFVQFIEDVGLENIEVISLDHDLGPSAMKEYFNNVSPNYTLNYENIEEKTGLDCAKYLIDLFYKKNPNISRSEAKIDGIIFPTVYTHSANPIGSANIMGYINNFFMNIGQPQTCVRVRIPHT